MLGPFCWRLYAPSVSVSSMIVPLNASAIAVSGICGPSDDNLLLTSRFSWPMRSPRGCRKRRECPAPWTINSMFEVAVRGRGRFGADARGNVGSIGSRLGVDCGGVSFNVRLETLREASCLSASGPVSCSGGKISGYWEGGGGCWDPPKVVALEAAELERLSTCLPALRSRRLRRATVGPAR